MRGVGMSVLVPDEKKLLKLLDLLTDEQCEALFDALLGRGVSFSADISGDREKIKSAAVAGNVELSALVYGLFLGQRIEAERIRNQKENVREQVDAARPVGGGRWLILDGGLSEGR